jgi:hypothetical protein
LYDSPLGTQYFFYTRLLIASTIIRYFYYRRFSVLDFRQLNIILFDNEQHDTYHITRNTLCSSKSEQKFLFGREIPHIGSINWPYRQEHHEKV